MIKVAVCVDPSQGEEVLLFFFSHEASGGLISTRSYFFVIGMSGEKKKTITNNLKQEGLVR